MCRRQCCQTATKNNILLYGDWFDTPRDTRVFWLVQIDHVTSFSPVTVSTIPVFTGHVNWAEEEEEIDVPSPFSFNSFPFLWRWFCDKAVKKKKLSEMSNCDTKFKLMMLGDAGVGKTSIARRFVDQVEPHRALAWLV